jgi:hypothetical protein
VYQESIWEPDELDSLAMSAVGSRKRAFVPGEMLSERRGRTELGTGIWRPRQVF